MDKLYLECTAGISGDMLVAALLDLGASKEALAKALASLPLTGYTYKISRVKKSGVDCCDFDVLLEQDNHDHDMEFLHGQGHSHQTEDHHHEGHGHHHADGGHCHHHEAESHHHSAHHHHEHAHRGLSEILAIINQGQLTANAKAIAEKIFTIIAKAEAKAHGVPMDQVHFHEVGAVDSIVDIVAIAVCFDNLGLQQVIVPKLCEGMGTVRCQHGILPVPVPAVANIVQAEGLPLEIIPAQGEFVTPTGAAAAAALVTGKELPNTFTIKAIGLGAGKRTYDRPSILRAMIISCDEKKN